MWWVLACTPDVRGLYEAEREEALTVATERPRDWDADLRVQIAEPDLEAAVAAAVRVAVADPKPLKLALPMGVTASLKPRMSVDRAKLSGSDACASCLAFDTKLDGHATWEVMGARGDFPFEVSAEGVLQVEVAEGRRVQARPFRIGAVRVKVGDSEGLRVNPSDELQGLVRDELKDVPPIRIVELDPAALPVRDLRLRTASGAVVVEALTDVPGSRPAAAATALAKGVRVSVSETALVGLARRAAYERGTVAMDVAADPRAIHVDGDRFTLDLRLWRLVGRGWWRDYEVTGTLAIVNGKLKLSPEDVKETDRSKGAGLVDPLAALFQNKVMEAIADVIRRSLPASRAESVGAVQLRAEAARVEGHDGTLSVEGTLDVKAP